MIGIKKYTLATLCVTALLTSLPTKTAIQIDGLAVGVAEGIACHLLETKVLPDESWYVKYPVSWIGVKIPTHLFTSAYLDSTNKQIISDCPEPNLENLKSLLEGFNKLKEYDQALSKDPNYRYVDGFHKSRRAASWLTYLSLKIYDAYRQKKENTDEGLKKNSSKSH